MNSFETQIRVEYHHTDQMGIVHHSNYVKFFEVARTEWLRAAGLTYAEMERRGVMMPIVEVQVKYRQPAYYDELITVRAEVDQMPDSLQKDGEEPVIFVTYEELKEKYPIPAAFVAYKRFLDQIYMENIEENDTNLLKNVVE